jgi:toxin ParE1/3/4
MSLPLVVRPTAQAEFEAAAAWYEERRPGLGDAFVTEVRRVLDTIADHPKRYPIADGDVREAPVSHFPYCVFYRVKPDRIVVIAVFHTSRDPSVWKGRM